MSSLVPFYRNRSRGELAPFQMMRSFFVDPFFNDLAVTPFSWAGGIRADVKDLDGEYVVEAEMPGVARDKISLDVHDSVLTISADEDSEQKEEKNDYIYRERRWGYVSRSFSLENVDEGAITADYKDGVLFVHLPKEKADKKSARKIEIQ